MLLAAFLRAKAEGLTPPSDVLLLVLSDEEASGDYGAKFLVDEHAGLFDGVRYALGEFGASPSTWVGAGSTPSRWPRSNVAS